MKVRLEQIFAQGVVAAFNRNCAYYNGTMHGVPITYLHIILNMLA